MVLITNIPALVEMEPVLLMQIGMGDSVTIASATLASGPTVREVRLPGRISFFLYLLPELHAHP